MSGQALPGTRTTAYATDPNDLVIIGVDTNDGPEHALYDERIKLPLSEEMVLDIMERGVMEPVLVRKSKDAVEVVDGRRRVLHAREANKRLSEKIMVPYLLRKGESDAQSIGVSISANEHRLDDPPMLKARKLEKFLAASGTEEQAAIHFAVTKAAIGQWKKMLTLAPKVQKYIDQRKISASAASKLADLDHEAQVEAVEKMIAEGNATVGDAKAKAKTKKRRASGNDEEASKAPGKRVIKKVIATNAMFKKQNGEGVLDDSFVKGIKWAIGDISGSSIKGLNGLVEYEEPEEEEDEDEGDE